MQVALPKIVVGDAQRHDALSVFPLFLEAPGDVEYRLSHVALADESLLIEEVDQNGSVPDLLVENTGDTRVLFIEGEELVGAKQNRILNTSILVPAHAKVKIPVSCVERGRWRHNSRYFGSSGSHSPSKLRRALKASVSRSVKEDRSHRSDQQQVWAEVASFQSSHGIDSATDAMSDTFDSYQDQIQSYRENLEYVENACGLAVAVGDKVISMDLFDKPSTCQNVWDRILSGVVLDAIEAGKTDKFASTADVTELVDSAHEFPWEESVTVGEGQEYRAESAKGDHASALAFEKAVVHGSLVASG